MSAELNVSVEAELSPSRFAEVGRGTGAFQRTDGKVVALVSDFDHLYWPGRAIYDGHRLRHRISLYTPGPWSRLGVFDGAAYPVNDIAFHPTRPVLAIATGSYDGGYAFEGELLLWNWKTGETANVLSENREVTRVRFVDDDALTVLLRPRSDEEYDEAEVFDTFLGGTLTDLRPFESLGLRPDDADPRIASFVPGAPASLHFDRGAFSPETHAAHWKTLFSASDYEPRYRVWDVAWAGDDRVLAVHDRCHLEAWQQDGKRAFQLRGAGHGVQIVQSSNRSFVNVIERGNVFTGASDRSTLLQLEDQKLVSLVSFEGGVLFSADRSGRVLCRDTGDLVRRRVREDRVIDSHGRTVLAQDLGHYDCFNHHLRIDGSKALYFLRGTPPSSHEGKMLCRVDASGRVEDWVRWDTESRHLMCSTASFLPDGNLVRAYRCDVACFIEVLEMPSGRRLWRQPTPTLVTSLISSDSPRWLFYGLTDGTIGVLDWRTGDRLHEQRLRVGDVDTVAMSLALHQGRIACGTLDGRVLILRAEERS